MHADAAYRTHTQIHTHTQKMHRQNQNKNGHFLKFSGISVIVTNHLESHYTRASRGHMQAARVSRLVGNRRDYPLARTEFEFPFLNFRALQNQGNPFCYPRHHNKMDIVFPNIGLSIDVIVWSYSSSILYRAARKSER